MVSSSGDWSGNLFDFFFHVYNRLKAVFPVPFQLAEDGSRDDDPPMHKALREMIVNTLVHADHYWLQGIVIIRRPESLTFANPGDMRTGLKTALSGGTSDARNTTIMKMFSLLDFGERAGSGIPDVFDICKRELDAQPEYNITYAPARTTLSIDISKISQQTRTIKADDNVKTDDKPTIKSASDDKPTIIVNYLRLHGETKTAELAEMLSLGMTQTKTLLYQLVEKGLVVPFGSNRNRTYKLKE